MWTRPGHKSLAVPSSHSACTPSVTALTSSVKVAPTRMFSVIIDQVILGIDFNWAKAVLKAVGWRRETVCGIFLRLSDKIPLVSADTLNLCS